MIIDNNFKCNNRKQAEFIEKYFLKNNHEWYFLKKYDFDKKLYEYPIIIYNFDINNDFYISWAELRDFDTINYKITDAKCLMRQEKLKKINKN